MTNEKKPKVDVGSITFVCLLVFVGALVYMGHPEWFQGKATVQQVREAKGSTRIWMNDGTVWETSDDSAHLLATGDEIRYENALPLAPPPPPGFEKVYPPDGPIPPPPGNNPRKVGPDKFPPAPLDMSKPDADADRWRPKQNQPRMMRDLSGKIVPIPPGATIGFPPPSQAATSEPLERDLPGSTPRRDIYEGSEECFFIDKSRPGLPKFMAFRVVGDPTRESCPAH